MAKANPLLSAYYARFEEEHRAKREMLNQITLSACFMAAHEVFGCGPGRALQFLEAYCRYKMDIAKALCSDVGESNRNSKAPGDPEFLHTKRNLALALKRIFGKDGWSKAQVFFGLLHEFWPWEDDPK